MKYRLKIDNLLSCSARHMPQVKYWWLPFWLYVAPDNKTGKIIHHIFKFRNYERTTALGIIVLHKDTHKKPRYLLENYS